MNVYLFMRKEVDHSLVTYSSDVVTIPPKSGSIVSTLNFQQVLDQLILTAVEFIMKLQESHYN